MADREVFLEALTPEAEGSLGAQRLLLHTLPFRVGRECRLVASDDGLRVAERRKSDAQPTNELYLLDPGPRLQVSRAHFRIELADDGAYRLVDVGSALGTLVGSRLVGGDDRGGEAPLADGDVIVAGTSESPFAFRFCASD